MTECVRVDMREIVTLGELLHPVSNGIGMHRLTVVPGKYEIPILIVLAEAKLLLFLVCLPFFQQYHCFSRQSDPANGAFGFWRIFIDPAIDRVQDISLNVDTIVGEVHGGPLQAKDLPAPCSGDHIQVNQHLPLDGFFLQGVADIDDGGF